MRDYVAGLQEAIKQADIVLAHPETPTEVREDTFALREALLKLLELTVSN